jgi:hypothetical protein
MNYKVFDAKKSLSPDRSLASFRENPPEGSLRRYMSLEKFFDLVINKHLTFSRLSEFEDKSEGYETAEVLRSDVTDFFNDLYEKGADQQVVNELKANLALCTTYSGLTKLLDQAQKTPMNSNISGEVVYQLNNISHRIAYPAAKRWFCLCFSQKETEDYLLWSAYTRGRLGVCVEFCQKQLASQLNLCGYVPNQKKFREHFSEICLGPVNYSSNLQINSSTLEEDYVFTKSDHFSGEQEFRIAGKVPHTGISSKNFHIRLSDISSVIKGVSISPFYSSWEAEAVQGAIQSIFEKEQGDPPEISMSNVTRTIE